MWKRIVAAIAVASAAALAAPAAAPEDARAADRTDFSKTVRAAKDKVFPALLYVRCIRDANERGRREGSVVGGSGVLVSPGGEFLTNWHVVERAREVRCLLADGRAFPADILGSDKDTDVAVGRLRLPPGTPPVPHALLADSDGLVEGDFVMAMGAPWGLSRSVSIGIVSCTRRYLEGNSEYSLWIQTDASISPGNSGGPLVNTAGAVVGLNARGVLRGGDLGFAIPSNTLAEMLAQIRAHGAVRWAWTGVRLQPLRDFESDTYFDGTDGVIVAGTDPDSPAQQAGLEPQDRLLAVNGRPVAALTVEDLPALHRTLGRLALGAPARFRVRRGTKEVEIPVVPRLKGAVVGDELACARWDLSVKSINRFERPDLYFHRKEGVFVFGVSNPGNAWNAGLRRGDVLLKVGDADVRTLDDVRKAHAAAIAAVATQPRLVLTVLRNGLYRQVVLDFARDFERD